MITSDLRTGIDKLKGRRDWMAKTKENLEGQVTLFESHMVRIDEAKVLIRDVAKQTQDQLVYHISEIATLALQAVFPNPYSLEVEFTDERRGKTECDIWLVKKGNRAIPLASTGHGPADIASLALLISVWSLRKPRTRPILILDEPMKAVDLDLRPVASAMLKEISSRLGMQVLLVTHDPNLVGAADRIFEVGQVEDEDGWDVSEIKVQGGTKALLPKAEGD